MSGFGSDYFGVGTFGGLGSTFDRPIHVREKPPLRHSLDVRSPSGRHYRWGMDAPDPANVYSGLRHSDIMPGGHEHLEVTLARAPGIDYGDMQRLSTIRVLSAAGYVASEARLERAPQVSGDQMATSPGAVGWQAHLSDDKSAREVYIDRDLSRWQGAAAQRKINVEAAFGLTDAAGQPDDTTGVPTLRTGFSGAWAAGAGRPLSEGWYNAAGIPIGSVHYAWKRGANVDAADTNWTWMVRLSTDDVLTSFDETANLRAAGPGTGTLIGTAARKFAAIALHYANVAAGTDGAEYSVDWYDLAVRGGSGVPIRGTGPGGVFASDVIADAVRRWAPALNFTEGSDGTIRPTGFQIDQLAFVEPTTAGEMIKQANRFHLFDWAVWEDQTFWFHSRGARGKRWRARIRPAKLEETGPQLESLWESVIVQFQDVDGSARTVGPPGSGATTESALLKDADPENPANQFGIVRRQVLQTGVLTGAGAIEVGARFLEAQKQLDSSGRAILVGHVEDDRGVLWPYSRVRAGDTISFVDAADPSYRRIAKTDKDHAARSCSIDLDAPPEGLDALLERLGASATPLGVG